MCEHGDSTLGESDFDWQFQSNADPWDPKQKSEWTSYPPAISLTIERAYRHPHEELVVSESYCINLKHGMQRHRDDAHRQRPVRRRRRRAPGSVETADAESRSRRERLSTSLGTPVRCSASEDTSVCGSTFVRDWLLWFSKGTMQVTYAEIFPVLLDGLRQEGQTAEPDKHCYVELKLHEFEEITRGQRSSKRLAHLQECCARLYTEETYVYRVVNTALRENDRSKLRTLGPFCYLLNNYLCERSQSGSSVSDRLRRVFHIHGTHSITLYRGDCISEEIIGDYRRSIEDRSKCFKWLPFVSTSRELATAAEFAKDVLYVMRVRSSDLLEDRFRDLTEISAHKREKETLLLPGVQFQVTNLEYNNEMGLHMVYIDIHPSYVSKLQ